MHLEGMRLEILFRGGLSKKVFKILLVKSIGVRNFLGRLVCYS